MAMIEIQTTIACPVTDVYAAVTNFNNPSELQQWQPALKTIGITAGNPLRTGSMLAMTRHFMFSDIFVNVDIVDLQRNKRIELKGVHGRFPFRREIEFTPSGRETLINDRVNLNIGWLFFWWRPFATPALRNQLTDEWQRLKQDLEN